MLIYILNFLNMQYSHFLLRIIPIIYNSDIYNNYRTISVTIKIVNIFIIQLSFNKLHIHYFNHVKHNLRLLNVIRTCFFITLLTSHYCYILLLVYEVLDRLNIMGSSYTSLLTYYVYLRSRMLLYFNTSLEISI